jgi:stalled ribosome alternative rescue factor ArfA
MTKITLKEVREQGDQTLLVVCGDSIDFGKVRRDLESKLDRVKVERVKDAKGFRSRHARKNTVLTFDAPADLVAAIPQRLRVRDGAVVLEAVRRRATAAKREKNAIETMIDIAFGSEVHKSLNIND